MRLKNGKRHAVRDVSVSGGCPVRLKPGKCVFSVLFLAGVIALFVLPQASASASGLIDIVTDSAHLYSRYSLDNYQLDFYVDTSWSWLPWSWMDGMERSILYGVYQITDSLWGFSKIISSFTGEVIGESYNLNLVGELSEGLGKSMQNLTGISRRGLSDGFLMGFLPWILLLVGVYVAYVGLIRRETSKAAGAVVNVFVIFAVTAGLIAYAPDYISNINDFSSDISKSALKVGTGFLMPGQTAPAEMDDSVELVRDNLFTVQVYQPWLILQYGTADAHIIGDARIENLLSKDPQSEYGNTREAVVIEEIEQYQNMYLTAPNVGKRFTMVLVVILVNLIISVVVILLCGAMLLSQIMFLLFAMVLPVSLVLAMFPTMGGLAKSSVLKVFNVIMFRAGITLLVTIAFCISGMIYSIADSHSFLMTGYLQIVVFVGIYLKKNEILAMFALHDSGEADMQRSVLRNFLVTAVVRDRMSELRMDRRQRRREKKRDRKRARQEAGDRRVQERAERRESGRAGAGSRPRDDSSAGNRRPADRESASVFSADGNISGAYRTTDSSPRVVRAGFYVADRNPGSAGTAEMPDRRDRKGRPAETEREKDGIRTDGRRGHPESGAVGSPVKEKPESAAEGRKKSAGAADGQQTVRQSAQQAARHSAGEKLRMQSADRTRRLLEKRKKAVPVPDRIVYQGEQYHGVWADALDRGNTAGNPVNPAETVHQSVDPVDPVRSSGGRGSVRHSAVSGSRNPGGTDKMQDRRDRRGRLTESDRESDGNRTGNSERQQIRPEENTAGRRTREQSGLQSGKGEKTEQHAEYRAKGMADRTVHRDPEEREEKISGREAGQAGRKGFIHRAGAGKRGDDA